MKTTGRSARGRSRSRRRTSLSIAPVAPEPQKMTTSSSAPLTRRVDDPAGVLAQRRGLPARRRRLRVRVPVQRQDAVADEVLDERQRAAGGRVVRVHEAARPERPVEHRVVADHRAADPRRSAARGPARPRDRVRMATDRGGANLLGQAEHRAIRGAGAPRSGGSRGGAGEGGRGAARGRSGRRSVRATARDAGVSRARGARRSAARAAFDASSARMASTAKSGADAIVASSRCGMSGFHTGDAMAARPPFATWSHRRFSGPPSAATIGRRAAGVRWPQPRPAREREMQSPTVAERRMADRGPRTHLLEREAELEQIGAALCARRRPVRAASW